MLKDKTMKKILLLFILLSISCKSQTLIYPISSINYGSIENAYYKDTSNFLNQYTGTWLYVNGNTSLKIILQKKQMCHMTSGPKEYYTDYIIGEYQYIYNGTEVINTLNNLQVNHNNVFNYNINGNIIINNNIFPICTECTNTEMRLTCDFSEPSRNNVVGLSAQMVFRMFLDADINNSNAISHKLKVWFYSTSASYGFLNDGTPTNIDDYSIPFGEYILTKQ